MESTYIKKNAPYSSQWFSKFPARGGDQALLSISELFQTPSIFYLALHDRYKLNALLVPLLRQVYRFIGFFLRKTILFETLKFPSWGLCWTSFWEASWRPLGGLLERFLGGFWKAKMRPRRPKIAPRRPKMAPRRPQDGH